jgi:hypothetical protein
MRALFTVAFLLLHSYASAQRLVAHDTLSMDTPSVVSCGFCRDEVIGVVFRELGGAGGVRPSDFPLVLTGLQIALADAVTDGVSCMPRMTGGTVMAEVEVWAGPTPPTALPAADVTFGMPWPDEILVFASDAVPLTLSTPTMDGGMLFNLQFNAFEPRDEMDMPITVAACNTYLRVAVRLPGSGMFNSVCRDPVEVPAGFPLRDNDGRLMDQRSFIYAGGGTGWLWNETAGLNGDWAIRIEIDPMPSTTDAGPCSGFDAGSRDGGRPDGGAADVGALDAGADAGGSVPGGGCGCRAGAPAPSPLGLLALALGLTRLARRR